MINVYRRWRRGSWDIWLIKDRQHLIKLLISAGTFGVLGFVAGWGYSFAFLWGMCVWGTEVKFKR